METLDWASLILRVGTGLIILAHGINHARGRKRTTDWFASIGFRHAEVQWFASTASEIAIGAALVVGLLTSPAAAGLASVMAVAFWSVHRTNGFFIFRPGEGWEYVAALALVGLSLAVLGGGRASADAALGVNFDGAVGVLLVAGGLLAAAIQIAVFFRPKEV